MSELSALLRDAVKAVPSVRGHLSAQALRVVHYAIGDMTSINAEYHDAITDALLSFFKRTRNVVGAANAMKRACSTAFNDAGDTGWIDGGADLPRDEERLTGSIREWPGSLSISTRSSSRRGNSGTNRASITSRG